MPSPLKALDKRGLTVSRKSTRGTGSLAHMKMTLMAVMIFAAIVACAAPVDLSAVQKYASTTAAAGASFEALANDFTSTCIRANAAQDALLVGPSPKAVTLIGIPAPAQLKDAAKIVPIVGPGYTYMPPSPLPSGWLASTPRALASSNCDEYRAVSAAWNKANSAVLSYVQSLGNLANVDAIPTPNTAPLASPLEQIGVSSTDVQAGADVISKITEFYYQQQAQRNIRGFLQQVNPSMAGAVDSLEVVNAAYSIELEDEFNSIAAVYGPFVRQEIAQYDMIASDYDVAAKISAHCSSATRSGCRVPNSNLARLQRRRMALAMDIVRRQAATQSALDYINNQRKASAAYGAAVAQILKTHQQLYAASQGNGTLKDYADIIQSTGAPVLVDLLTLAKAVNQ